MKEYRIRLLSKDEFKRASKEDARYSNVDETNLGFADPLKGEVCVLDTKCHELNKYLIDHEVEHLFEEEGTHEDEHGIRHKKFFKEILLPLFTGYNAQQKSWSPLGILDPKNLNPPDHADALDSGDQQMGMEQQAPGFTPQAGQMGQTSGFSDMSGAGTSDPVSGLGTGIQGGINQPRPLSQEEFFRTQGFYRPSF